MKCDTRIVRKRNDFWYAFWKPGVLLFSRLKFNYQRKSKYKIKKGEQVFVLSNHQTDADATIVPASFNKALHTVCTDSITSNGFVTKLMMHCFAPVPIKKGAFDPNAIQMMMRVKQQGGNLLLFPEGNRTYAEFQYEIGMGTIKLIKSLQMTLVLFNLVGGTGVSPRFGKKCRKGHFEGRIVKVLKPQEYNELSNEELYDIVKDSLCVFDSYKNYKYKSKSSAEYLERMFFVCPVCGRTECLRSEGQYLYCDACGLKVKYTENLKLESDNPNFKFTKLNDWYQYQKEWTRNFIIPKDQRVIYKDDEVKLYLSNAHQKRKLLSKGSITLTKDKLVFADKIEFDIKSIANASPISGKNFNFTSNNESYLVKGSARFNPLKYVFMFNKLDTLMNRTQVDKYYSIAKEEE